MTTLANPTEGVWCCEGCGRIGRTPTDLLRQGCEGKPEKYIPEAELEKIADELKERVNQVPPGMDEWHDGYAAGLDEASRLVRKWEPK